MTTNRLPELTYENDESLAPQKRDKWMYPESELETMILSAVGRMYYKKREERNSVIDIAKKTFPLGGTRKDPIYAKEFVEFCCEWAIKKRENGELVNLLGLVHFIKNMEAQQQFVAKWRKSNKKDIMDSSRNMFS